MREIHKGCYPTRPGPWSYWPSGGGNSKPKFPMKGIRVLLIFTVVAFLVSSCAFKQPEGKIITEIVAQDVGYLIAKENPKLATRILKYMETEPDSISWKAWMIAQLVDDEFLRMNFEKLVLLIEVDLEGIDDIEKLLTVITPILRSFAKGIRVGLKVS